MSSGPQTHRALVRFLPLTPEFMGAARLVASSDWCALTSIGPQLHTTKSNTVGIRVLPDPAGPRPYTVTHRGQAAAQPGLHIPPYALSVFNLAVGSTDHL